MLRAKGLQRCAPSALSGGTFEGGRQALRAFLRHIPAGLARTGRGRRGFCAPSSVGAPQRKPALPSFSLLFSEPLPAPAARSQSKERKKKRGGGGSADSSVLPVLLWEDSSAATGGEGLRGGGCEGGPGSPRGLPLTAPRASSGGGCCTAGGGSPRGCATCGNGWSLVRSSPRALSFLKYCKVFRDQPGNPIHVRKTRETWWGGTEGKRRRG